MYAAEDHDATFELEIMISFCYYETVQLGKEASCSGQT